jgi:signal peptidase I
MTLMGAFAIARSTPSGRHSRVRLSPAIVKRRLTRVLKAGVLLLASVLLWQVFGPLAIGGGASYVVTDGVSMLPHFRADGLVVTRAQKTYHVGEVVAYHNPQLGAVVMHRIVAMDGDRYVFKGDNNSFRDSYHARTSDVVGEEWLYIPQAGRYLRLARTPALFATVLGLIAFFAAAQAPSGRSRGRRHGHGS